RSRLLDLLLFSSRRFPFLEGHLVLRMNPISEKGSSPSRPCGPDRTLHRGPRPSPALDLPRASAGSFPALARPTLRQGPFSPGMNQRGAEPRPVLVIDDDQFGREALARILEVTGYRTMRAANGLEGLGALRGSPPPGLIILDLVMPVVDGWEL